MRSLSLMKPAVLIFDNLIKKMEVQRCEPEFLETLGRILWKLQKHWNALVVVINRNKGPDGYSSDARKKGVKMLQCGWRTTSSHIRKKKFLVTSALKRQHQLLKRVIWQVSKIREMKKTQIGRQQWTG